ncbi:MAG: DUF3182 family protein [Chloroflexota bacterium]|nr:DUF3182 family protein [Chloroflexota bacterium]
MRGYVVTCLLGTSEAVSAHERVRNAALAERIATVKGLEFAGEYDPSCRYRAPLYLVPHRTIVGGALARQFNIRTADDLFGGVVPFQGLATKAIMHGLIGRRSARPRWWTTAFAEVIANAVLPGYTVFSRDDAYRAAQRLLTDGYVRVKRTLAAGGLGQCTIGSLRELELVLADLAPCELATCGLVLERHLDDMATYSVGQVRLAGLTVSYYGVQRATPNNCGGAAYGGSDLVVVRGDYERLFDLPIPDHVRLAVSQAATFDLAVQEHYPRVIASRRNYDVGQGVDASGRRLSGVIDQSWRIGGASGPEIAAIEAFRLDPTLELVEASSVERYGEGAVTPPGATVHFDGVDPECGPITLYTVIGRTREGSAWKSTSSSATPVGYV